MAVGIGRLVGPALLVAFAATAPGRAAAQELATPELRGRVLLGSEGPAAGAMVVLHRIDPLESGEVDSVRADGNGDFRFRLPTVPDPGGRGDVYLASVRHQDVLYFGQPVTTAIELDSLYFVQVWDTVAAPPEGAPVGVSVRYLLAQELPDGWRVTDLFELDVPGDRTWVAPDSGVTWRYPLPAGFRDLQIGAGDGTFTELSESSEGIAMSAPLSPGSRQVIVRYTLPSLLGEIPLPGGAGEIDLLVREPAPSLAVRGLTPTESVEIEPGASYRRFAGAGVPDGVLVVMDAPEPFSFPFRWLAVLLGFGLAGVGVWAAGRPRGGGAAAGRVPDGREALVAKIARLDLAIEAAAPGPQQEALRERRRLLMTQLRDSS